MIFPKRAFDAVGNWDIFLQTDVYDMLYAASEPFVYAQACRNDSSAFYDVAAPSVLAASTTAVAVRGMVCGP